jgi:nicotinamide mononucleotide transporter
MQDNLQQFFENLRQTTTLEYVAVVAGIVSVVFSRKENIWVYPTGLVNTIIYIYLSFKFDLIGEASVNFYYTVMSVYGWLLWSKKDQRKRPVLQVTFSDKRQWLEQLLFFLFFMWPSFGRLRTCNAISVAPFPGLMPLLRQRPTPACG